MATITFTPAIVRTKAKIVEKSSQVTLKLVPELSIGQQASRKFFATFVSVVGVLGLFFLLFLNTILAQDAIKLNSLKLEAKLISDQREAVIRSINFVSSPEALAKAAIALGMKPSDSPIFLDITNNFQDLKD